MLCLPLLGQFDHTHCLWNDVLGRHVQDSYIDYLGLAQNSAELDIYLKSLDSITRDYVDSWSANQQLAFWINAYNAFTVRVILDNYPIRGRTIKGLFVPRNSIIQIPGVWKKITWEVAGQSLTLDQIEHAILRTKFKEPRIHFAIVCASIGCPDLLSEAFRADQLERQLDGQTRSYLSNAKKGVKLDFEKKRICVSKVFGWFWEDFVTKPATGLDFQSRSKKERAILSFLSHHYSSSDARALFRTKSMDLDYLSYDWALNDIPPSHDSSL